MKTLTLFFTQIIFLCSLAQDINPRLYHEYINEAQISFVKDRYEKVSQNYLKAFEHKEPYWQDLSQAINIELDNAKTNEIVIKKYMKYVKESAINKSGTKQFNMAISIFPKLNDLPYVSDLKEYFINNRLSKRNPFGNKKAFDDLLEIDQAIRDSVIHIKKTSDIYNTDLAPLIKEKDSVNMIKLIQLMQDTTLTSQNCPNCFMTIEMLINHASSNGNVNWLTPLNTILQEGRMDLRQYVRIIDEAHNKPVAIQFNLFFGSFNGIRLYDCIYFSKYKGEEKKRIERNRKKYGYISLKDEMAIKVWQYKNNDKINFYPFISFMYSDGSENEKMKKELLNQQELILEDAKRYNKVNVVRK